MILGSVPNAAPTLLPASAVYNVKSYGAVGDNSTDDTAAIAATITALRAAVLAASGSFGGFVLYFPPGFYKITSTLDMTLMPEVRILGGSGRGGWSRYSIDANPPTCINFTAGGSGTAIDLADSQGCVWDGVSVWANTGAFSGVLMSFDATAASDVFGNRLQNCQLRAVSGTSAILLSLDGNIEFSADNVTFHDAGATGTQVRCLNSAGAAKWSNANSFRSCSFIGTRQKSILNPGPVTTLIDCTFEPTASSLPAPISVTNHGQPGNDNLTLIGCGFWDATGATGSWITSTVTTNAWAFYGCRFDCSTAGPVFSLSGHTGLVLSACMFTGAGGGTPNVFAPGQNITNAVMQGCVVASPVVDNHASVFV